jgi:O-antigen/teichoic acid export membrane protein
MEDPESQPATRPRRHLAAGAALSTAAEVGLFVAAGVLSIVLARVIGPAGNGTFALLTTVMGVTTLIFSLGLTAGITYEVSGRRWPVRRALAQSSPLALVLGLAGAAAGLGFYALTRHTVLHTVGLTAAVIGLCAIPALLTWQFTAAILLGRDRYEGYASLQLVNAAVMLLASVSLAIPFGVTGAIIGLAAAAAVTALAGLVLVRRDAASVEREPASANPESRPLKGALRFGLTAWIANILQQVNYRFDVLILGAYAAIAHVGVYSVALTLTSIAWFLPHGLQTVIFPRTADLDAAAQAGQLSASESDSAVARGIRHSVLLLVPSGFVVAVLLALVPLVYGSPFHETVPLGFVLLPGVLALGVGKVVGSVVAGRGAVRYNLYTGMLTAAVTLTLYLTLIPAYHEWGAAVASCISYFASAVIALVFFRRRVRIALSDALIPTSADLRAYPEALAALADHLRTRRVRRYAARAHALGGRR